MNAPLARTDDADRILRGLVERVVDRVADRAPGAVAVVLVGSASRGEATVLPFGAQDLVLSDLDLAVVYASHEERERAAPRLAQASRDLAREFGESGFLAAVDLGAYALADLPRQVARPGTLEWKRSGRVLAGDAGALHGLPAFEAGDIPAEEAILLCENRLLELLAVEPLRHHAAPRALAALYAGGKGVLDAALALLVAAGSCPGGVEERAAAFLGLVPEKSARLDREALAFWTRAKLAPTLEDLARRFGPAAAPGEWADPAWREGAVALLAAYRHLVETRAPGRGALLARAAGRARTRRRLRRALEAWRARRRRHLAWATLAAVPAFVVAGAPEHVLGATAAELAAEAAGAASLDGPLGRAPAVRGLVPSPGEADWEARRRAAVRAWDRWVLRGTRTEEGEA